MRTTYNRNFSIYNMTGATSGAGNAHPSGAHEFISLDGLVMLNLYLPCSIL